MPAITSIKQPPRKQQDTQMHLPGNQRFDSSRHTKSFLSEDEIVCSHSFYDLHAFIDQDTFTTLKTYFKTHSPTYCPTHSEYNDSMQRNCKTSSVSLEKDNEIENHVCGFFFPPKGISKEYGLANKVYKKSPGFTASVIIAVFSLWQAHH